jgi:hypothetical protein
MSSSGFNFFRNGVKLDINTIFAAQSALDTTNSTLATTNSTLATTNSTLANTNSTLANTNNTLANTNARFDGVVLTDSNARVRFLNITNFSTQDTASGFAAIRNVSNQQITFASTDNPQTRNMALKIDGGDIFFKGGEILLSSDIRIKKNINQLNSKHCLDCIRKIEPVKFTFIEGNITDIGFIAQQTDTCIPEAVGKTGDFLPNILCCADIREIDTQTYDVILEKDIEISTLNPNCPIKIMKDGIVNTECIIMSINSSRSIVIKGNLDNVVVNNKIFLYGSYVDDFHTISKNMIFTYAVSAVKQLDIELQEVKNELQDLKNEMCDLKNELHERFVFKCFAKI